MSEEERPGSDWKKKKKNVLHQHSSKRKENWAQKRKRAMLPNK